MRRSDRERDRRFAYEVIDRCQYGVAAFSAGDGAPYCIPLSLVRVGDDLYFHCALEGRKLDLLRQDPRVCVAFVTDSEPAYVEEKNVFTSYFRSAVVTGTAEEVSDPGRKAAALRALCEKLLPAHMDGFDRAVERSLPAAAVWRIRMEEAAGKEKAPARKREKTV